MSNFPSNPDPDGTIRAWTTFHYHCPAGEHEPHPINACLCWTPADPVCLTVEFYNDHGTPVRWFFSRDLLADGLGVTTGCGDVRVGPGGPGELRISLTSPSGHADFSVCAKTVEEFLLETVAVCPRGSEFARSDFDTEWLSLLAGETS